MASQCVRNRRVGTAPGRAVARYVIDQGVQMLIRGDILRRIFALVTLMEVTVIRAFGRLAATTSTTELAAMNRLNVTLVAIVLLLGWRPAVVHAAPILSAPFVTQNVGDTFSIAISVADVLALTSFQFDLGFDPTIVQVLGFTDVGTDFVLNVRRRRMATKPLGHIRWNRHG